VLVLIYTLGGISIMVSLIFLSIWVIDKSPSWSGAERRADALLRDVLTREQYILLNELGYLDIPSPTDPQRVYRVPRALGQVKVIENERVKASLCLRTVKWVPDIDRVVIHKLMIEADEDGYLQKANRFIAVDSSACNN